MENDGLSFGEKGRKEVRVDIYKGRESVWNRCPYCGR